MSRCYNKRTKVDICFVTSNTSEEKDINERCKILGWKHYRTSCCNSCRHFFGIVWSCRWFFYGRFLCIYCIKCCCTFDMVVWTGNKGILCSDNTDWSYSREFCTQFIVLWQFSIFFGIISFVSVHRILSWMLGNGNSACVYYFDVFISILPFCAVEHSRISMASSALFEKIKRMPFSRSPITKFWSSAMK